MYMLKTFYWLDSDAKLEQGKHKFITLFLTITRCKVDSDVKLEQGKNKFTPLFLAIIRCKLILMNTSCK